MKLNYYLILFCLFLSINSFNNNDEQSHSNINDDKKIKSFNDLVIMFKHYHLHFFLNFEYYIIRLHSSIKNNLNILPPYDIMIFFVLGSLIKIISSILIAKNSKDTYVYNTEDNAESLYNILNKLNEIATSLETQSNDQIDNQLDKKIEITSQAKAIVNNISKTMDNITSQLNYLKSVNENLHETIHSSQSEIMEELDKNNNQDNNNNNEN